MNSFSRKESTKFVINSPGKSKLDQFRPEIEALLLNGSSQKYIADRYRITETTLSNRVKKNAIKKYQKAARQT